MLRHLIIDKFRGFSHLELHDLGRVNLLVGTNNCGKTSVLEAIELLVSRGHAESIFSTTFRRGERLQAGTARRPQIEMDLCRLFHNFELEAGSAFRIAGMVDERKETLTATISELPDSPDTLPDEFRQSRLFDTTLEENSPEYIDPYQLSLVWNGGVAVEEKMPVSPRGGLSVDALRRPHRRSGKGTESYFIPTASLSIDEIVSLFEETVLTPVEDLIVEALRTIEPTIERIASVGTDRRYHTGYPGYPGIRGSIMVKCTGVQSRVPIGSLGDGIWRMLGLVLAFADWFWSNLWASGMIYTQAGKAKQERGEDRALASQVTVRGRVRTETSSMQGIPGRPTSCWSRTSPAGE